MFHRLPIVAALLCLGPIPSALASREEAVGLTREEIEEGWILLFDGETAFGWEVRAERPEGGGLILPEEAVSIDNGILTLTGPARMSTTTRFGPFELEFRARCEGDLPGSVNLSWRRGGGIAGATHQIDPAGDGDAFVDHRLVRTSDGRFSVASSVRADSGEIELRNDADEGDLRPSAVTFSAPEGGKLRLTDIRLRPTELGQIFNGKDLSGWNVLEGGESVYSVTDEGDLNVKNGRGDIQTEGQYDDFVLQLDVFSNGEHLNSGIFFRAIPGEFWSGYESQIRNEYEGEGRTKPVDYGTGAIYRRQAARKVVADDFEWFTKTIVAHDNHFAVWVDGYQVTDWTDDRPAADNGRNGYKAAPGVISIQGHDPTTDLSFRNLRIAELPGD